MLDWLADRANFNDEMQRVMWRDIAVYNYPAAVAAALAVRRAELEDTP
jgi:hypothetical protein